ncbi:Oidioi.mRNA.OKI2018_I69.XSR.g16579.t1.cds [Oikopleura dioica]|uniref:Oidioi.mRNA.OKI2018_I69.XSR.g16579.t1.cds n=1 Tax=Oikopleura dioica TaxID=34765 RepID=A0ABN7SKJ5_OIKDI|nr:Oidioi.mRNA.OKI2018_I69.XSR.g16579.t1.cds [Oikopleura dioica]
MSESSVIQKSEEELELLKELKNEFETLEQSWKEENEKFIQFQLLANRDRQLADHVLTENQKTQLRTKSVKKQIVKEKSKASSPKFPKSESLDSISSDCEFGLVKSSKLENLEESIEAAEKRLEELEKLAKKKEAQEKRLSDLAKEEKLLSAQLVHVKSRRENLNGATERAEKSAALIKQSCLRQMNLSHSVTVGYPKPLEELCSIGILLNATFGELEEEVGQLSREPFSETKKVSSSPHVETKDDLLREISAERKILEFRRKVLKRSNELLQEKSDNLLRTISQNDCRYTNRIKSLERELHALKNSTVKSIKLKHDALSRSSISELEILDSAILSLEKELSSIQPKTSLPDSAVPHPSKMT